MIKISVSIDLWVVSLVYFSHFEAVFQGAQIHIQSFFRITQRSWIFSFMNLMIYALLFGNFGEKNWRFNSELIDKQIEKLAFAVI